MAQTPGTTTLDSPVRRQLKTLIDEIGEPRAQTDLQLSRLTLARAVAGLRVRRATAIAIIVALNARNAQVAA